MAEILFLDVEWNQVGDTLNVQTDEIVQIGAICTWQELDRNDAEKMQGSEDRQFFKIVRPQNMDVINEFTIKTMNLTVSTLEAAKSLEEVVDSFIAHFPEFDMLVVWNRDAYKILWHSVKRLGRHMPKHKVVILQDVLSDIALVGKYGPSIVGAIGVAGIEYDRNWLHCAKHDVRFLKQMYYTFYESYKEKCVEDHHEMCLINSATGTMHIAGCGRIMATQEQNRLVTHRWKVFQGAKVCKCCNRNGSFRKLEWKRVKKSKPHEQSPSKKNTPRKNVAPTPKRPAAENLTDEYILTVCQHYGVVCNVGAGVIFVRTNVASWRIYHNGRRVTSVYHENYRFDKDPRAKKRKLNEGFHRQDVKFTRLDEVVRYIESHDREYLARGIKRKSRLERLLEMVGGE